MGDGWRARVRTVAAVGVAVVGVLAVTATSSTENRAQRVGPDGSVLGTVGTGTTVPFTVGDEVLLGDWTVRVNGVTDPFVTTTRDTPREGYKYVVVDITVGNESRRPDSVSALACFELEDDTGREYRIAVLGDLDAMPDGEVDAGGTKTGVIAWEVPELAEGLRLRFKCELFSRGSAVIALP